ncbi:MAG: N-acetylmuramoyl-L-alanine amidase [Ruminococcus sp.]|nr:N-acetylmuramoyl-L-alanine amidase [Ruminococcus sp.]
MSKICFIVGHGKSKSGGYDPGATSGTAQEFKIAKEIAKYAQQYYNATYQEQADLINYDGSLYLTDRINKVNASGYDFVAEIHLNAGGGTGTECYYSSGNNKGNQYATAITDNIASVFGIKNRGAKVKLNSSGKDYFAIIRETDPTGVLIETVFIDTASDLDKVNTAVGQKRCGEAIAKAVAAARGAETKPEALSSPSHTKQEIPAKNFRVKITCDKLNIRADAGTDNKIVGTVSKSEVFTIVETKKVGSVEWGRLKSGAGWISLKAPYSKRI